MQTQAQQQHEVAEKNSPYRQRSGSTRLARSSAPPAKEILRWSSHGRGSDPFAKAAPTSWSSCTTDLEVGAALANGSEPRPWLLHLKISFAGGAEERANRVDPERCR